ncbi:hypothetical protein chiPu_0019262 [Chiloscyllium punctatum]|uniref:Uncharacterized protein n=1 Tax=Chiloscyllium punctatum TaxID=137246 RepID=A0A401RR68_CHIPU|nr:hypothetical protein [Chiloscyllium punctatum]
MAQAAKQLKKIKDVEAQAQLEQEKKEEEKRKRRNRSRERKRKSTFLSVYAQQFCFSSDRNASLFLGVVVKMIREDQSCYCVDISLGTSESVTLFHQMSDDRPVRKPTSPSGGWVVSKTVTASVA